VGSLEFLDTAREDQDFSDCQTRRMNKPVVSDTIKTFTIMYDQVSTSISLDLDDGLNNMEIAYIKTMITKYLERAHGI